MTTISPSTHNVFPESTPSLPTHLVETHTFRTLNAFPFSHLSSTNRICQASDERSFPQNFRLDMFNFANDERARANTAGTYHQRASDWNKWEEFLFKFGISGDRYLEEPFPLRKIRSLWSFRPHLLKGALYGKPRQDCG